MASQFNSANTERRAVDWRGSAEIRADIINSLKGAGYKVYQCREFEEVLKLCSADPLAVLIVDGSASGGEASQRAVEVNAATGLQESTILFVASNAYQKIEICRQHFKNIFPIDIPYREEDLRIVLEQLNYIELAKKEESLPKVLKTGGAKFTRADRVHFFNDHKLLQKISSAEKVREHLAEMDKKDIWLGLHARRVGLLISTMGQFLNIDENREKNVRAVGLMLNVGVDDSYAEFKKINPLLSPVKNDLKALSKKYRRSAKIIKNDLSDDLSWKTANAIANLLDVGTSNEKRCVVEDAEFVILADFADRACWRGKEWDPRSARGVIRVIREGLEYVKSKALVEALARSLVQSLVASCSKMGMYGAIANPVKFSEVKETIANKISSVKQRKANLWELAPGMVLANPIISTDGTLLACPSVKLDEDMLWRLWSVLGLKPMEPAVYVQAA